MVLPSCVLLVKTIVADLFCPYGVINREVGRKFTNHKLLHEFLSLIPIFCLAVPIAFCYSGVRKSRTQFTQKGGKTLCSKKKPSASEVDDVQYRRAKTWQIICYACNAFVGMSVYSLIGMASYSASIGYGITTATVGIILMLARILDAFTDPMLAFVYDRVNTRFGKLRVLLISGYLIEAVGLLCMFNLCSSKGFGLPVFVLTYIIYIIGYTVSNMTIQTLPAIMTNDPRQRPTIGVWTTALNYFVPMGMSMLVYTVILPKCGGTFNQGFLSTVCTIVLIIAGIGTLIVCAGISAYDKPETLRASAKITNR